MQQRPHNIPDLVWQMLLMGLLGLAGIFFVPVLLRLVAPQVMATVLVAQVYVYYLVLLVQFGFAWSGPAAVARAAQPLDAARVWRNSVRSKLYWLLGPAAVLLGVGYAGWGDGRGYVLGFTALLGAAAVNSNWFLQATKNFAGGVGCALAGVVLSALLVWALMGQGPLQSTWLTWLTGVLVVCVLIAPQVLLGVGSWWLARRACQRIAPVQGESASERASALDALGLLCLLRKDAPLVASQLLLLASTTLGTVVVGQLADAPTTAAYAATEKLFNLGATVLVGGYMAFYPRLATSFYSSRVAYWHHTKRLLASAWLVGLGAWAVLQVFGPALMGLYLSDALATQVTPVLGVFAVWLGLCMGQHVLTGYLVLAERHRMVLYANALVLLVTVVVGYAFARAEPIHWAYGMVAGQLLTAGWLLRLYLQDRGVGA